MIFAYVVAVLDMAMTWPRPPQPAPPVAPKDAQPIVVPTPPAPPNAVNDGIQHPAPGEANDHSSPAFKDGGKPVPQKR